MEEAKKIKPIIPRNTFMQTGQSYRMFMKKGYKVLPKLEIDKTHMRYDHRYNTDDQAAKILKLFKTLKYVPNLNLSKLLLTTRTFYLPRVLYLIKKMSKAHTTFVYDVKMAEENYKGISDVWLRKAPKLKTLGYAFDYRKKLGSRTINDENTSKNFAAFFHGLKYQSHLKEIYLQVPPGSGSFSDEFWNFERYPNTLERLSLKQINSYKPLTNNTSLSHLKNLRHLELTFSSQSSNEFITSVFQSLPLLSSHLQSLSLSWPSNFTPDLQGIKALNQVKQLKINLAFNELNDFGPLLGAFSDLSLSHLSLTAQIKSEELLVPISTFLENFKNLEHLKLQVTNEQSFTSRNRIQETLGIIDNLSLLKTLSVSIVARSQENQLPIEFHPVMAKIFTKPIPLESFKIELRSVSLFHQEFLQLFKSLQLLASNLKKLQIDIGNYNPTKSEEQTVLDFIKSLKTSRTLRLESLSLPNDKFFIGIVDVLNHLPFLESVAFGEVKEDVTPELFVANVEQILSKRGLQGFECHSSSGFKDKLKQNSADLDLQKILKKNPSLKTTPQIPIYNKNTPPTFQLNLW